jgi:hypothetical protein
VQTIDLERYVVTFPRDTTVLGVTATVNNSQGNITAVPGTSSGCRRIKRGFFRPILAVLDLKPEILLSYFTDNLLVSNPQQVLRGAEVTVESQALRDLVA